MPTTRKLFLLKKRQFLVIGSMWTEWHFSSNSNCDSGDSVAFSSKEVATILQFADDLTHINDITIEMFFKLEKLNIDGFFYFFDSLCKSVHDQLKIIVF